MMNVLSSSIEVPSGLKRMRSAVNAKVGVDAKNSAK